MPLGRKLIGEIFPKSDGEACAFLWIPPWLGDIGSFTGVGPDDDLVEDETRRVCFESGVSDQTPFAFQSRNVPTRPIRAF